MFLNLSSIFTVTPSTLFNLSSILAVHFPISVYLVAAGVGTVRIVDCENVELSNLNRQLLHWDRDIGRRKVESAREKLREINPTVNVEVYDEVITDDNA
ncbi:MAG: ThiF family adenylyltransferase, partial [archaeon YNP-LCB-003-016]|uniref:HesA/MoeB/ThiF family protein n=1 Tax=Candidatus Culexarchaeum yellowstonense TaxID=2928963 RepID=UPI0026EE9D41